MYVCMYACKFFQIGIMSLNGSTLQYIQTYTSGFFENKSAYINIYIHTYTRNLNLVNSERILLRVHNFLECSLLVVAFKWCVAANQLEQNHSQRPTEPYNTFISSIKKEGKKVAQTSSRHSCRALASALALWDKR